MKSTLERIIDGLSSERQDAVAMRERIRLDPRRKLDAPCEKLHYWDGKAMGLELAITLVREGFHNSRRRGA